ncbi:MAG: glutathione peroxidase [Gammaproteobacteria bacterium]|nr:glutathione peroxidase [Gammaproteobacteria bacterium]
MTTLQRIAIAGSFLLGTPAVWGASCPDTLNHDVRPLNGGDRLNLCDAYLGKVVLVVNTASYCGFTNQYEGLEALYREYKDKGLVVLGFPSNDFGGQEPGTEKQIQDFCRLTYGVQFPMFEKTHASKTKADGIYRVLGEQAGEYPRWNFHKYLLDRDGQLAGSFPSAVRPESRRLVNAVESLL